MEIKAVGGLTLGADPIAVATAVYSASYDKPVHAFIIRKEPKGHGTQNYLEGAHNVPRQSPGETLGNGRVVRINLENSVSDKYYFQVEVQNRKRGEFWILRPNAEVEIKVYLDQQ